MNTDRLAPGLLDYEPMHDSNLERSGRRGGFLRKFRENLMGPPGSSALGLILTLLGLLGAGGCEGSKSALTPADGAVEQSPVPTDHAVEQSQPLPLTIRFGNDGATPLYLRQACVGLEYGISSSAGGYRDALGPAFHCACSCADTSCRGALTCGQCPEPSGLPVAVGGTHEVVWPALRVSETDRGTYRCLMSQPLPAGRYRLAVNVYDTAADAMTATAGRLITVDFELSANNNVLMVSLSAAADRCDANPTVATPVCTATASREIACDFPGALKWFPDGGFRAYADSSDLMTPARYTRTRRFVDPVGTTTTPVSCTTNIPRCSLDARVATTGDIAAALGHPDVKAAFARGGMLVYGHDSRPVDGSILIVQKDGGSFGIGGPCDPATDLSFCARSVPPGLMELLRVLTDVDSQQQATPPCGSLPSTPP